MTMKYECADCNMSIEPLKCSKCNQELVNNTITKDGKNIKVAMCEICNGMIKSPQCCGKDMAIK